MTRARSVDGGAIVGPAHLKIVDDQVCSERERCRAVRREVCRPRESVL